MAQASELFDALLIEPFWNRNEAFNRICVLITVPFNRTILESKRGQLYKHLTKHVPFNRTILESKLSS